MFELIGVFFIMSVILTAINVILFILVVRFFFYAVREKKEIMQIALDAQKTQRATQDIVEAAISNFEKIIKESTKEEEEESPDGIQ